MISDTDLLLNSSVDDSMKVILEDVILPLGKLDKCKDDSGDEWSNLEAQAAFLGPNIWDKSSGFENELQLGDQYVDLDEFLNASVIGESQQPPLSPTHSGRQSSASCSSMPSQTKTEVREEPEEEEEEEEGDEEEKSETISEPPSPACSTSENDSDDSYEPPPPKRSRRARAGYNRKRDAEEDLKPLPMVKKSRKQFVPDDMKDDRYWARRRKNNLAAKRSRDARRMKENQIVVKAGHLEDENLTLKKENDRLKVENKKLKAELAKLKK